LPEQGASNKRQRFLVDAGTSRRIADVVLTSSLADKARAAWRASEFVGRSAMRPVRQDRLRPDIPTRLITADVAAGVLLDELLLLALPPIEVPAEPAWRRRANVELDSTIATLRAQGWDTDPRAFHRHPTPPTAVRVESSNLLHVRYETLSFESGFEARPGVAGADRWQAMSSHRPAYAYVLRHRAGDRPWVLAIHGYADGNPTSLLRLRALRLHRECGFNVLVPVLPLHGPRRAMRRSGTSFFSYDYPMNLHSISHAIWDIRRCIAWARSEGAEWMGVHGMSLGGYLAALLAGIEDGLGCVVAGIPLADLAGALEARVPLEHRGELRTLGLLDERLRMVHQVVNPLAMACLVPRGARAIYAGVADRIATAGQPYQLWLHWDRPAVCWYAGSHLAGTWLPSTSRFVEKRLLAATQGSVATAGQTSPSGWRG
jgi:dienelactone hydrolase